MRACVYCSQRQKMQCAESGSAPSSSSCEKAVNNMRLRGSVLVSAMGTSWYTLSSICRSHCVKHFQRSLCL